MSLQKFRPALDRSGHMVADDDGVYYLSPHVDGEFARLREDNELLRRAVEWCLENGAERMPDGSIMLSEYGMQVPAEFAEIICPASGKGDAGA